MKLSADAGLTDDGRLHRRAMLRIHDALNLLASWAARLEAKATNGVDRP